jgi:hypothetical protein
MGRFAKIILFSKFSNKFNHRGRKIMNEYYEDLTEEILSDDYYTNDFWSIF